MTDSTISTQIYQNAVPAFVAAELERLYENVFSSLSFLDVYRRGDEMHTYVRRVNDKPTTILLFQFQKNRIQVMNEGLEISAHEIERFCNHMFSIHRHVDMISFNAIRTNFQRLHRPSQKFNCLEDIVVPLPGTVDEYTACLGKATRKNIKRYFGKLTRTFPTFVHEVYVGEQIQEQHVRDIIALNRARMAGKNKTSSYSDEEVERLIHLVRRCGLVSMLLVDGKVCAGEICSQAGAHYFVHTGAHDPQYDEYRLGTISCYLCICECIRRNGKEFHFLWGQYEYKYMLAGVQRDLDHLTVYRSQVHFFINGRTALRNAVKATVRKLKCSINAYENLQSKDDPSHVGLTLLKRLRSIKQALTGMTSFRSMLQTDEAKT